MGLQAESARLKALVDELELAQLSANNRQELSRMRSELAQKQSEQLDAYLQALRNQLNSQRQREAERALESTELLAENSENLPAGINEQFRVNRELSAALNQQAQRMDLVASQQRQATNQTLQVRQALNTLREQSQWLGSSNLLGEALRAQVARLPEMPKPQQLDTEMAQLRVQRLHFEDLLNKQPQIRQIRQADGQPLTSEQNRILEAQLRTQRELLNSLLQGGDTLILELTKLKVSNSQLEDALKEAGVTKTRFPETAAEVRGNIEFMNQLNQAYTYVQVPLKMSGQNANGELYVYTNKKNLRDPDAELSAFLHLDLEHLGSTDVSVKMQHRNVKTNFYMADDASYDLVEKYLPILEQKLKDKGYQCTITMTKEEKKVSFGDDFLRKDMPQTGTLHRYSFDVRA